MIEDLKRLIGELLLWLTAPTIVGAFVATMQPSDAKTLAMIGFPIVGVWTFFLIWVRFLRHDD